MSSIIDEVVNFKDPYTKLRTAIERARFKKCYQGNTLDWDIKFDDFRISSGNVVLIAYDKDLDSTPDEWLYKYQIKEKDDSVTVYHQAISDIVSNVKMPLATYRVKTSAGSIDVPYIRSGLFSPDYAVLPVERSQKAALFFSGPSNELIIPTETMSLFYSADLGDIMKQIYDPNIVDPNSIVDLDLNDSCKSFTTLYLTLYTGCGRNGCDYIMDAEDLEASIVSNQEFVDENQGDASLQQRIDHILRFLRKYLPLIKKP